MSNQSVISNVSLRREEDFASGEKPTVSLVVVAHHDLVLKNLEKVVPHVEELVLVMVEPHQGWLDDWREWLAGENDLVRQLVVVDPHSHPHLFTRDAPETYQLGSPLAGETYCGPFSGQRFVNDWSTVRNLGWSRCSQEWRLSLDQHEILLDPEDVAGACDLMSSHRRDLGYGCRRYLDDVHPTAMLAPNVPLLRWECSGSPSLEGCGTPVLFDNCLLTSHPLRHRDEVALRGAETFRILYAEARRRDWDVPPSNLVHLARCARYAGMGEFALPAIDIYLDHSFYTEERAWACAIRGEICESRGDFAEASRWYERSLAEHPGWKSALRLCRSRFLEGKWQQCLDAYSMASERRGFTHIVDDGGSTTGASLILVVSSLHLLGRDAEARKHRPILLSLFPHSQKVAELCSALGS